MKCKNCGKQTFVEGALCQACYLKQTRWDWNFLNLAFTAAAWSKDPSTKVGCAIVEPNTRAVVSLGYNGFPRGIEEGPESLVYRPECCPNCHKPLTDIFCNCGDHLVVVPEDEKRWDRPQKYDFIEHAERNAILNAARLGHRTEGCWAYINWSPIEGICPGCTRALIQAGIRRIVGPPERFPGKDSALRYYISMIMFAEAGVELVEADEHGSDVERE